MKAISLILLLMSSMVCAEEFKCSNGLMVKLELEKEVSSLSFTSNSTLSGSKVQYIKGKATVRNASKVVKNFSTDYVKVSVRSMEAFRGYKQSVASEVVDFGNLNIQPNEIVQLNMYWPTKLGVNDKVFDIVPVCIINN